MGGTFDPVHNGHLGVAQAVSDTFDIDEVHFIPAFSPPHKPHGVTSPFHRFAMVALAVAPYATYRLSALEVDTLERQYSVDTIDRMKALLPDAEFLFIIGTDMYASIETWHQYRRLFELVHVVVVNRPGFDFRTDVSPYSTIRTRFKGALPTAPSVFFMPDVHQPVSSTEIRNGNKDAQGWLPASVWEYIERNRLYT